MLPEHMTPILNAHHSLVLGLGVFGGTALVLCLPRLVRWLWRNLYAALMLACVGGIVSAFAWMWR